jgi:hypothetical protein
VRLAVLAAIAALVPIGCGGDDRPSEADWAVEWDAEQALVPTEREILDGGRPLCVDLVGEYRESMSRLTPTPTASLDAAVEAWVDDAESLVFECPDDLVEVEQRLADLAVLTAEIAAGLEVNAG